MKNRTTLLLAAAYILIASVPLYAQGALSIREKPTVAVFDFEVRAAQSELQALAREIPEAMVEAIIARGAMRPVEREALMKVLAEQELALSGLVDQTTAARIGRLLGARYILLGSATVAAEQAKISCRLVSTETAEIVWAGSARGALDDLFAVEDELAAMIAKATGE